jgi:hypothetical protein
LIQDKEMGYKLSKIKNTGPLEPPCKKTIYNSLQEAQDMIRYIKDNRETREIRAYKCLSCGFWHLTSKAR